MNEKYKILIRHPHTYIDTQKCVILFCGGVYRVGCEVALDDSSFFLKIILIIDKFIQYRPPKYYH